MSSDETNYYRARAEAERALAVTTGDPAIAAIHEKMALLYDRLIELGARTNDDTVVPFERSQAG